MFDTSTANQAQAYSSLFDSWDRIAGTDIASHSRIVDVQHGALVAEVDHPGWIQMIRLREKEILDKLATSYPSLEITHLKVRAAADPDRVTEGNTQEHSTGRPNDEVELLRGVESAEHGEFRALLERMKKLGKPEE